MPPGTILEFLPSRTAAATRVAGARAQATFSISTSAPTAAPVLAPVSVSAGSQLVVYNSATGRDAYKRERPAALHEHGRRAVDLTYRGRHAISVCIA